MRKEEHGRLGHASITHNPNNTFRGPYPDKRENDPHRKNPPEKIDTEIRNVQSKEYQEAIDRAAQDKTFKSFSKIPPGEPITTDESKHHWKENTNTGKYFVAPPKQVILI
mgnify:CR=1 FL=1